MIKFPVTGGKRSAHINPSGVGVHQARAVPVRSDVLGFGVGVQFPARSP